MLYEHEETPSRAFSQTTSCYATQVLEANVQGGTGKNAQLSGYSAAGKTGTTEKNTDTWFVGFTPELTTAVWMGIPESGQARMKNLGGREQFGGLWPATIWKNFNQQYLEWTEAPSTPFPGCPTPFRGGRPARGEADPDGSLNRTPTEESTQPPSNDQPPAFGGGGAAPAVDDTPAAPTTVITQPAPVTPAVPPAEPATPGGQGAEGAPGDGGG